MGEIGKFEEFESQQTTKLQTYWKLWEIQRHFALTEVLFGGYSPSYQWDTKNPNFVNFEIIASVHNIERVYYADGSIFY